MLRPTDVKVIENVGKQPRARSSFKPRENTHHAEDLINTRLSTRTSLPKLPTTGTQRSTIQLSPAFSIWNRLTLYTYTSEAMSRRL